MSIRRCLGCMREIEEHTERCPYCGFCKDDPVAPHLLPPRTALHNRYVVGRAFSTNGDGVTYIGFDAQINRPVIIREYLPLTLASREEGQIVVKPGCEAKFKALKSDFLDLYTHLMDLKLLGNIRKVYEIFEENGTVYAVCEYLNLRTLNEYLLDHAGELTWEETSALFKPLLESMVVINSSGVIHRGISPETIVVTEQGTLCLIGFSICSARSSGGLVQSYLAEGYAAPEQYSKSMPHGEWTDVYALCAVLYKVLSGTMPPIANSRSVNDNLIDLYELNHTIPQYVSRAVMRGLAYDYQERTRNVRELINGLYFATRMDQTAVFRAPTAEPIRQPESKEELYRKKQQPRDKYLRYVDDDDDEDQDVSSTRYLDYEEDEEYSRPHKKDTGGKNNKKKKRKKKVPLWAIVLLLCVPIIIIVCLFLYDVMIGFSPKNKHENNHTSSMVESDSSQLSSSKPESSSSEQESSIPQTAMIELRGTVYDTNVISKYADTFNIQAPTYEYNDLPAGQICSQSVEPGTMVTAEQEINIVVSKGPQMITVPDYAGYTSDEYITLLMTNYDVVGYTEREYSDTVPAGQITRVDPGVGAQLDRAAGTQVKIYISIGPDPNQAVTPDPNSPITVPGGEDVVIPTLPTP